MRPSGSLRSGPSKQVSRLVSPEGRFFFLPCSITGKGLCVPLRSLRPLRLKTKNEANHLANQIADQLLKNQKKPVLQVGAEESLPPPIKAFNIHSSTSTSHFNSSPAPLQLQLNTSTLPPPYHYHFPLPLISPTAVPLPLSTTTILSPNFKLETSNFQLQVQV